MMSFDIDPEILEEFIKETSEELDALDPQFITLEKKPNDPEVINSIFRTVHSIKGASAFFNLNHMRNFAHKLENLLDELRKGERKVTKNIIDILLVGKDLLSDMIERLSDGDMNIEMRPKEAKHLKIVEDLLDSEEESDTNILESIFERIDEVKASLIRDGLGSNALVSSLLLAIDEMRKITLDTDSEEIKDIPRLGEILIEKGLTNQGEINKALGKQKKLGEILVETGAVKEEDMNNALATQVEQTTEAVTETKKVAKKKSMRIEEEKIDGFMDLVGELIINAEVFNYLQKKLEIGHDLDKLRAEFKSANVDFNELTFSLQRRLAEVRKVSINGILQKLPRMVRDLAGGIGKQVDFSMSGEDILIDKSLFERLEAPLNHIIRNAVDHGVELPEHRARAGKDPIGTINVSITESQGELIIQIADNGKGMDAEKLKQKAVEKEMITETQAAEMSDKEAYSLIFSPGFSTAAKVTDVSGRGVGMDVVMTALKEAKGKVEIDTVFGEGSTFIITLPMSTTLITISGLVVAVGVENYIIPMEWVKESLRPDKSQITTLKKQSELVKIRDELYPLMRLHKMFDIEPRHEEASEAVVMVLEKEGKRCCLLVDEIIEETQVVLKDLGAAFKEVTGIMGGAILGDGKVGLVVSVDGVLAMTGVSSDEMKGI